MRLKRAGHQKGTPDTQKKYSRQNIAEYTVYREGFVYNPGEHLMRVGVRGVVPKSSGRMDPGRQDINSSGRHLLVASGTATRPG